jgi:hypothetical protein
MNEDITTWRKMAVDKRQSLREQYDRYRKLGSMLATKGWVKWNGKGHCYGAPFLSDRSYKERTTIQLLLDLQKNIGQQAMLLLELEHACDCEETKRNNQTGVTNDNTDKKR